MPIFLPFAAGRIPAGRRLLPRRTGTDTIAARFTQGRQRPTMLVHTEVVMFRLSFRFCYNRRGELSSPVCAALYQGSHLNIIMRYGLRGYATVDYSVTNYANFAPNC